MKTTLTTQRGYNPFFLDGKQVRTFIAFDHTTGKTLYSDDYGRNNWFASGNNPNISLTLPFEVRGKRKIDLTKNESFYVKYDSKYKMDANNIVVYLSIHQLPKFIDLGLQPYHTNTFEKSYQQKWAFTVQGITWLHRLDDLGRLEYYPSELQEITVELRDELTVELTEMGKKAKALQARLEENGIKLGAYEVEKLLSIADIKFKKG